MNKARAGYSSYSLKQTWRKDFNKAKARDSYKDRDSKKARENTKTKQDMETLIKLEKRLEQR